MAAAAANVAAQDVERVRLEEWPLEPGQILEGDPRPSGCVLHDGEGGAGTGIWECTPGRFEWSYDTHQSLYVVRGRAAVEIEGGPTIKLETGVVAFFPAGTRARWTVRETLRKVYTTYR